MMAKYIASLTNEQRAELTKKSTDLMTERTVKQLEIKLEEAINQRNQATDIIKNLTKENEELKFEIDEMKNLIQMKDEDFKTMEKDFTLMNELFEEEKAKYEIEIQKMDKMNRDILEKEQELELRAKEQALVETEKTDQLDRHIKSFDGFEENETNELSTAVEKKLYTQFQDEKKRTMQLKQQIDTLLSKLEDESKLQDENQQLREYCAKLEEENTQQLEDANEVNISVQNEVVKLAQRNARLEQEKQELLKDLESKVYELTIFRKGLELSQKNTVFEPEKLLEASAMADEIYGNDKYDSLNAFEQNFDNEIETGAEIEAEVETQEENERQIEDERREEHEHEHDHDHKFEHQLGNQLGHIGQQLEQLEHQVEHQFEHQVGQQVGHQVEHQFEHQLGHQVGHQNENQNQNEHQFEHQIGRQFEQQSEHQSEHQFEHQIGHQLGHQPETERPKEGEQQQEEEEEHEIIDLTSRLSFEDVTVKDSIRPIIVPDVLKEYLHLTATAVKIKYPKVNIESDELIKRVQFEPYYNYFERMVQIMQAEEAKTRVPKQNGTAPRQNRSFFAKMKRKMFGISTPHQESSEADNSNKNDNIPNAVDSRKKRVSKETKIEKKEVPLADQPFVSVSTTFPVVE